jgi:hypothetical protein
MTLPLSGFNLVSSLTCASSGSTGSGNVGLVELNLPIGTTVATGSSLTTANVPTPGRALSCIFLVQLSSGTATLIADTTSNGTTPSFASANKVTATAYAGSPTYVGPVVTANATQTNVNGVITTTAAQNIVALQINNVSGATLTLQALRLLCAMVIDPTDSDWFAGTPASFNLAGPSSTASLPTTDKGGTFLLNT